MIAARQTGRTIDRPSAPRELSVQGGNAPHVNRRASRQSANRRLARRDAGVTVAAREVIDRHRTAPDVASPRARSRRVEPREHMDMREITPSLVVPRDTGPRRPSRRQGSVLCHPERPQPASAHAPSRLTPPDQRDDFAWLCRGARRQRRALVEDPRGPRSSFITGTRSFGCARSIRPPPRCPAGGRGCSGGCRSRY